MWQNNVPFDILEFDKHISITVLSIHKFGFLQLPYVLINVYCITQLKPQFMNYNCLDSMKVNETKMWHRIGFCRRQKKVQNNPDRLHKWVENNKIKDKYTKFHNWKIESKISWRDFAWQKYLWQHSWIVIDKMNQQWLPKKASTSLVYFSSKYFYLFISYVYFL